MYIGCVILFWNVFQRIEWMAEMMHAVCVCVSERDCGARQNLLFLRGGSVTRLSTPALCPLIICEPVDTLI